LLLVYKYNTTQYSSHMKKIIFIYSYSDMFEPYINMRAWWWLNDKPKHVALRINKNSLLHVTGILCYWDKVCWLFYICQILQKKWDYSEAVSQLFRDFKRAYYSIRREVLYNILTESGIPMTLLRLFKRNI
jgi:hypothetical protein